MQVDIWTKSPLKRPFSGVNRVSGLLYSAGTTNVVCDQKELVEDVRLYLYQRHGSQFLSPWPGEDYLPTEHTQNGWRLFIGVRWDGRHWHVIRDKPARLWIHEDDYSQLMDLLKQEVAKDLSTLPFS